MLLQGALSGYENHMGRGKTPQIIALRNIGSPKLSIHRTFRSVFEMACQKKHLALTKLARRRYRNPVILAQEWQQALAKGEYASPADLARHIGVSRARVTQILRLLKLSPEALEEVVALGDPLPSPIVTERSLRPLVDLPIEEQKRWIGALSSANRARLS
jgi:hypothetical protein